MRSQKCKLAPFNLAHPVVFVISLLLLFKQVRPKAPTRAMLPPGEWFNKFRRSQTNKRTDEQKDIAVAQSSGIYERKIKIFHCRERLNAALLYCEGWRSTHAVCDWGGDGDDWRTAM